MVKNQWFPSGHPPPLASTSGGSPLHLPPEPPDGLFSLAQFPMLSPVLQSQRNRSAAQIAPSMEPVLTTLSTAGVGSTTTDVEMTQIGVHNSDSMSDGTVNPTSMGHVHDSFTVLPPRGSSPLLTNNAIAAASTSKVVYASAEPTVQASEPTVREQISAPTPISTITVPTLGASVAAPRLVDKIRKSINRTLQRKSPPIYTENGKAQVTIPEEVFQRGAESHKDFIVCYFSGRIPPFKQIQSVLNHLWGKGRGLEIHTNHLTNSMLVRIPNEFIRLKVLEKKIWYVGDSMLRAFQWPSPHKDISTAFSSFPIWAHLKDVPLDLRTLEGLSWVAGAIGEPKETDDFTLNLTSLVLSHVKVEVDFSRQLPQVIEITRSTGEVVMVEVSYPWLPSTCAHCKQMGHSLRNCLLIPHPAANQKSSDSTKVGSQSSGKTHPNQDLAKLAEMAPSKVPEKASVFEQSTEVDMVLSDLSSVAAATGLAVDPNILSAAASGNDSNGLSSDSLSCPETTCSLDISHQRESPLDVQKDVPTIDSVSSLSLEIKQLPNDHHLACSNGLPLVSEPPSPSSVPSLSRVVSMDVLSPDSASSAEDYEINFIVGLPAPTYSSEASYSLRRLHGKEVSNIPKKFKAKTPLHSSSVRSLLPPRSPIEKGPLQFGSILATTDAWPPGESVAPIGTISGCINRPSSADRDDPPPV